VSEVLKRLGSAAATLPLLAACGGEAKPAPTTPAAAPARTKPQAKAKAAALPEIDPAQVVLGLRGHETELHDCFDHAGEDRPSFVQLGWRVTEEGEVKDVQVVRSTTSSNAVGPCLAQGVEAARFGRPGKPLSASWTFVGGLPRFEDAATKRKNRSNANRKRPRQDDRESGVLLERSSPGKIDENEVEGIVQNGYRLFAHCYRDGLSRDPELGGAVRLRFVIGTDGSVARVIDSGSDLPDRAVVACVAESFFALRFPKPSGGNVHLQYRFHLNSG